MNSVNEFAPQIISEYGRGHKVLVVGLGVSGLCAARSLAQGGAEVWVWDDDPAKLTRLTQAYNLQPWPVQADSSQWQNVYGVYVSAGVPHIWPRPHPLIARALAQGVPLVSELDLAHWALPEAKFIGITGTNGKSTTTALTYHILHSCGVECAVGGNLGTPVLALPKLSTAGVYVLEVSSYQLSLANALTFDYAGLLSITPDHLQYHWGEDGYIAAKKRIFRTYGHKKQHFTVVANNPVGRGIAQTIPLVEGIAVIGSEDQDDLVIANDCLYERGYGRVGDFTQLTNLKGWHNYENIALAYSLARQLGLTPEAIWQAVTTFVGLPHRQEIVGTITKNVGGRPHELLIINDSKATNVLSACAALGAFEHIYWIAGGVPKGDDLGPLLAYQHKIRYTYLIGQAAPMWDQFLQRHGWPAQDCKNLDTAVANAVNQWQDDIITAPAGRSVLLLAPGCASFDQFKNFEDRGNQFRKITDNYGSLSIHLRH